MIKNYLVTYLANIVMISRLDGVVTPEEEKAIEMLRRGIGASQEDLQTAVEKVENVEHNVTPVGRFSDKIRNFEDMLFVAMVDGEIALPEKTEVLAFAKEISLTQDQINEVLSETKRFVKLLRSEGKCPDCGKGVTPDAKFCIGCGAEI